MNGHADPLRLSVTLTRGRIRPHRVRYAPQRDQPLGHCQFDARLLTADALLASTAGDRAILVGADGGVAERPASYAVRPWWTAWKGAVAYLGELRSAL